MDLTGYRHRDPIEPSCTSVVCDMAHLRGLSLLESMNSRQARTLAGHVDHPSAEVPGHHHRAAGEERLTDRERMPHSDAVPPGRSFVRVERPADHGVDTVARHEQVGLDTTDGRVGGPVDELAPDRAALLLPEADEVVAGVDALGTEAVERGPVEDAEELALVNGQLGPPVAGGEAPGLAPDPLPVPGVVHELRGGDADAVQILEKTELGQLA